MIEGKDYICFPVFTHFVFVNLTLILLGFCLFVVVPHKENNHMVLTSWIFSVCFKCLAYFGNLSDVTLGISVT